MGVKVGKGPGKENSKKKRVGRKESRNNAVAEKQEFMGSVA